MKKKFLVEVCEHRRVKFEVEAENKEEAKKVAEDTYQNDDDLMSEMLTDDAVVLTEVDVLHERGPATGIVGEKGRDPALYAIISVKGHMVHLEHSVNPDASCCQESEEALQLETYSRAGWNEDKADPRLVGDFWGVWNEWNGCMPGGIILQDDFTFKMWDEMIAGFREVAPSEIKDLEDGEYVVYADMVRKEGAR